MKTAKMQLLVTAICALALTGVSHAGIKYWDNQAYKAYDVDDYVQSGLVLNYDGIRNAGPNAPHDPDATTWKNLGSGGETYDMVKRSASTSSGWADGVGFHFAGDDYFKSASKHTLPEHYEIETLVDAKASDASGIGYIYTRVFADTWNSSDTAWNGSSIAVRPTWSQTVSGTTYKGSLVFNTHYYSNGRPMVPSTITAYDYITALGDSKAAALFTSLDVPTTMPGYASPQSGSWTARNASYIYLGGHDNGSGIGEALTATVKNFRCYSRILSVDERAWNRVVDEARYFDRKVALPVTNVVIASNIPIVTGNEPVGCYAVDAGGYTFSAPASKVVKRRNYTCAGYTLETWNVSTGAWGDLVLHDSELTCAATPSSLIRITWLWTPGDGLVQYDADDYVHDGLLLHYDGIRNAGLGFAHDSAATTWVNLGSAGATYDMTRYSLVSGTMVEGDATGSWTDDGFMFAKNAFFYEGTILTVQPCYTLQTTIEATANDQNGVGYVMSPSKAYNSNDPLRFSIGLRDSSFDYGDASLAYSFYHNAADTTGGRPAVSVPLDETVNYGTAMLDLTNGVFFTGTSPSWNATGASNGHAVKTTGTSSSRTYGGLTLGGDHGETGALFAGTLHGFRYYNRLLNNDELAWNRIVDESRYFTDANVVVASTRSDVQANEEDGVYQVSGAYTFTAPTSVTNANGIVYASAGYAIQTWDDANGVWGAATEYEGASYAYTTAAGKVRLLWRWRATRGIRSAADYDVSDYVAGGLLFNLDGIRNAGATAAHAETPETWVNLGSAGSDATIRAGDAANVTNWTDNGFYFNGDTRFFATFPYTTTFTLQLYADAVQNDQKNPSSAHIYPFTAGDSNFALSTYDTKLYFRTQGQGAMSDLGIVIDKAKPWGHVNAILDDATKTAKIFSGTTASFGASKTFETMAKPSISSLTLGGGGSDSTHYLVGTINYFRYYDRVLSDAELAQNRQVDQARYFGALGVTNVFVVAGGGTQAETGAYKVDGEWTFTATTTVNRRGETVPVERYSIETLVNGAWADKQTHSGNSYTYTEGSSPATLRLRWLGKPDGIVIILR